MKCPKCHSPMGQVSYESIEVDRCTGCKGLWFDAGEMQALKKARVAEDIDTGDPRTGERFNSVDRYNCPRCGGGMIRMVDARQSHIWYEQCSSCNGLFLDAGEFEDISSFSVADFFRRFSTPERR